MGELVTEASAGEVRLHYVDWLRVLAVLLLLPFHTLLVYYTGPFYVKASQASVTASHLVGFMSAWHMPLLFALAGTSAYFALAKRTGLDYSIERLRRLVLPFALGIFLIVPVQTWYGARFNSGYTGSFMHYMTAGDFVVWNLRAGGDYTGGFGMGHLWFLLHLFLISIATLPLLLWWRRSGGERGTRSLAWCARCVHGPAGWLVAAVLLVGGQALPPLFGEPVGYYLIAFLLGFAVMADERFQDDTVRWRWLALLGGLTLSAAFTMLDPIRNALPNPSLGREGFALVQCAAAWMVIFGAYGFGRRWLDRPSAALAYLTPASFSVYLLHQAVIVVLAFHLVRWTLPSAAQWAVLLVGAVVLSFAGYEFLRRIPGLRVVIGVKDRGRDGLLASFAPPRSARSPQSPAASATCLACPWPRRSPVSFL
jgi:glucans biosynthesis protein C